MLRTATFHRDANLASVQVEPKGFGNPTDPGTSAHGDVSVVDFMYGSILCSEAGISKGDVAKIC
jgi:hypothetical protein